MKHESAQALRRLSGYRWWLRKYRGGLLKTSLWIFAVVAVVAAGLYFAGLHRFEVWEVLFAGGLLLFFALYGCYLLGKLLVSFFRKPVRFWYGSIADMRRILLPNRNVRALVITATVNGKPMDAVCQSKTYHRAEKGQRILLFTFDEKTIYCVHPEM